MIRRGRSRSIAVPRRLADDETLSFRALGVAVFILSKPDNWRVDGRALARTHAEGRDAVFSALKELEAAGYLVRRRYQDPDTGKWWSESVLYESLEAAAEEADEQPPSPNPDSQDPDSQDPENRDSVTQDPFLSSKREIKDREAEPARSASRKRPPDPSRQPPTVVPRTLLGPDPVERLPADQAAADIDQARAALRQARHPDPQRDEVSA